MGCPAVQGLSVQEDLAAGSGVGADDGANHLRAACTDKSREAHDFTVAVRQFMAERAKASAEGASTSMPAAPATGVTEGSTDSRNRTSPYPVTNGFGSLLHAASSRHIVACKKTFLIIDANLMFSFYCRKRKWGYGTIYGAFRLKFAYSADAL